MQIKEAIMHIFDYSFLDEGLLPAEIVNLTSTIAAFNAISGTRKENNKSIYTELEKKENYFSILPKDRCVS